MLNEAKLDMFKYQQRLRKEKPFPYLIYYFMLKTYFSIFNVSRYLIIVLLSWKKSQMRLKHTVFVICLKFHDPCDNLYHGVTKWLLVQPLPLSTTLDTLDYWWRAAEVGGRFEPMLPVTTFETIFFPSIPFTTATGKDQRLSGLHLKETHERRQSRYMQELGHWMAGNFQNSFCFKICWL